jgi:hypothetical protein
MQPAKALNFRVYFVSLAALSIICGLMLPSRAVPGKTVPAHKESEAGEILGPITDCDRDGITNDARIDFDGDGVADECIPDSEEMPEPPFQQTDTLTAEAFYSKLPAVGWNAQYQCADGLYTVTLSRPSESQLIYSSTGIQLTSEVVYDDIDPNLNQPLIIKDPLEGIRYRFQQEQNGEFYEYALADYGGNVGLYVYQTGEQIVAAPCQLVK